MLFSGIVISEGIALAPIVTYKHVDLLFEHICVRKDRIEVEKERYLKACSELIETYENRKEEGSEGSSLINTHIGLLKDEDFNNEVLSFIQQNSSNAEWALEAITNKYIKIIENFEDEYLKERSSDIKDIRRRLHEKLTGKINHIRLSSEAIIYADYLNPSELLSLDRTKIKGLVLSKGGETSHIAILSKSFNIPALSGVEYKEEVENGSMAILDAVNGLFLLNPDESAIREYKKSLKRIKEESKKLKEEIRYPTLTKDGSEIKLELNIESIKGVDIANKLNADGIGLFRTEFLILENERIDPEKYEKIYIDAVKKMSGRGQLNFRTFDIGGDKVLINQYKEKSDNPFLGSRSIRFCMEHKDIFHDQLVAILKASKFGKVGLMFPMVSGLDELKEVLSYLEEVKAEMKEKNIPFDENIKIGTMIEVPSAAIIAEDICRFVDFLSIGTNDLIQYTIAVDRGNSKVSHLYKPLHPAVIRLLSYIVGCAKKMHKSVAICGEMAGVMEYTPLLIGLGFRELSLSGKSLLGVKRRIRELRVDECVTLAMRILSISEEKEIEKELRNFNERRFENS